jgi:hypothetical protein
MLIVFTVVRLAERKWVGVWGDCGRDCVEYCRGKDYLPLWDWQRGNVLGCGESVGTVSNIAEGNAIYRCETGREGMSWCVGRLWEGLCRILQRERLFTVDKFLSQCPIVLHVKVWWRHDTALWNKESLVVCGLLELGSGEKKLKIWTEFCFWGHHWDQILKRLEGLLACVYQPSHPAKYKQLDRLWSYIIILIHQTNHI